MSVPRDPEWPREGAVLVPEDVQDVFCATLVDEWIRAGTTDAVVCPGSRNTPLVLALAERAGDLRVHVRLDERSAGFFALGIAKVSERPVVVSVTSGTAAAELHAAVVEASHAAVALIVCTADRPARLRHVGAAQTIDQPGLFASAVRWASDPGTPTWRERSSWRSFASRAWAESTSGPAGRGPVHLNLPFDEPLVGGSRSRPVQADRGETTALPAGRPDGRPWHSLTGHVTSSTDAPEGASLLLGKRALVLVGAGSPDPQVVLRLAEALGAPVVADPLSGARVTKNGVIAAADLFLRSDAVAGALRPHAVVRIGGVHASKVLAARLHEWAALGTRVVHVDDKWRWLDPERDADTLVDADPSVWCRQLAAHLDRVSAGEPDLAWVGTWSLVESEAQQAIDSWCDSQDEATEPAVARTVARMVPPGGAIVAASSMPVRDLEWFGPCVDAPPRVFANRGANGIDGVISTAMGIASANEAGPVVALVGDLAFLHDLTAFVAPGAGEARSGALTVVVVDNGGGGIFSFLPQRQALDDATFERFFGTPQLQEVSSVAAGLGLEVTEVSTMAALDEALRKRIEDPGPATSVIAVKVADRETNVVHHEELREAVGRRIGQVLASLP